MSTLAAEVPLQIVPERPGLGRTMRHSVALMRRNLLALVHLPALVVGDIIRPIVITLLFNFVLGGSIILPGGLTYIDYLLPGVLVQQVIFASSLTAVGLATDITTGTLDRFRSLPIARSAYLIGRMLADTLRILMSILLVGAAGWAIGFTFNAGFGPSVAGFALVLAFGFAFSWIGAATAMALRNPETVQTFWIVVLIPLIFASSIFASPTRMPGWLQPIVEANPLSVVSDAARSLLNGAPVGNSVMWSLVWIVSISVVFFGWAVRSYRKMG
jgi:ABC-2 type transport system permease protein